MPYLGEDEIGELGSTATPRREPPSATARPGRGLPSRRPQLTATRSSGSAARSRPAPATHTPTPPQTNRNWLDDDPERDPSAQSDETAAPREPILRIRALSPTHTVGPRTTTQLEQDSAGNPSHTGPTLEQMMQQARTLRARYPEAPLNRHEAAAVHEELRRWLDAHPAPRAEENPVRQALSVMSESDAWHESPFDYFQQVVESMGELQRGLEALSAPRVEESLRQVLSGMSESDFWPEFPFDQFQQMVPSMEELQRGMDALEVPRVEEESPRRVLSGMSESDEGGDSLFYRHGQTAMSIEALQRRLDTLDVPGAEEDPLRQAPSRMAESDADLESPFYRHHQAARSMEALQRRLDALRGPHAEEPEAEAGDPNQPSSASSP